MLYRNHSGAVYLCSSRGGGVECYCIMLTKEQLELWCITVTIWKTKTFILKKKWRKQIASADSRWSNEDLMSFFNHMWPVNTCRDCSSVGWSKNGIWTHHHTLCMTVRGPLIPSMCLSADRKLTHNTRSLIPASPGCVGGVPKGCVEEGRMVCVLCEMWRTVDRRTTDHCVSMVISNLRLDDVLGRTARKSCIYMNR